GQGDFPNQDPINVQPNALFKITALVQGSPDLTSFYDVLSRQVKLTQDGLTGPVNVVSKYDAFGNLYQQSNTYDYLGNNAPLITTYGYDQFTNMTSSSQADQSGSTPITANYLYSYGSGIKTITATTNPGASNPNDTRTTLKKYDATGLLVYSSDNAAYVGYGYGAHHSPVEMDFNDNENPIVKFTYDNYGRKKNMWTANGGTTTYTYNWFYQIFSPDDDRGQRF